MSENLPPEDLAKVLHDFLNPMSKIVVKHGGTIDKFMGDAIMALYGAPSHYPDHARRACDTAIEMLETLRLLDQEWVGLGRPSLKIGVGINSGPVAVGNMGSDTLFDYTAIGDNVNLASRLEGLNKFYGTEILVAGATVSDLGQGFYFREVDLVRVKGKKHPIAIYEILGEGEPEGKLARRLELHREALALFRAGRFKESLEAFQEIHDLSPDDPLCGHYLQLAEKYVENPPGPDWDGVTTMESK